MASHDINDGLRRRFEDGGTIIIRRAGNADEFTVLNVIAGTLQFTPKVRERLEPDKDRGVLLPRVRKGDEMPGTVQFNVKFTADLDADDLITLLTSDGTTDDNYLPDMEMDITVYNGPNQNAGEIWELTGVVRDQPPTITAGEQFDTLTATFLVVGDFDRSAVAGA